MSIEVHDVLVEARAIIADPERWTKGFNAKDDNGEPVLARDSSACRWCAAGALAAATQWVGFLAAQPVYTVLREALPTGYDSITTFNDSPVTTHADVLALFDRAIEATKL